MKKILSIFLVAITLLSVLLGCSDSTDTPEVTAEMPDTTSTDTTAAITVVPDETDPIGGEEEPVPIEVLTYEMEELTQPISLPLQNEATLYNLVSEPEEHYSFIIGYISDNNDETQATLYLVDNTSNKIVKRSDFDEIIKRNWPEASNIELTTWSVKFSVPGKYENGVIRYETPYKITKDSVLVYKLLECFNHEPMKPFECNSDKWYTEIESEYDNFISVTVKGINGKSFTYLAEEWGFEPTSNTSIPRQLIVHPTLNCALLMCEDKITVHDNHYPPRAKALLISLEDGKVIDEAACYTRYSTKDVEYPIEFRDFYWTISAATYDYVSGISSYIYNPSVIPTENGFEIQISIIDPHIGEEIFPVYYKTQLDFYADPVLPKDETRTLIIDGVEYILSGGYCEALNLISKDKFTKPIEFIYNGQKITVEAPIFTGIPVDACDSYKNYFPCIDGNIIFNFYSDGKTYYVKTDKNGNFLELSQDYSKLNEKRSKSKYLDSEDNKLKVELSDKYEHIGYFYNGLALIMNDHKIGIIDKNGNEILPPCIEYDTILYAPKAKEFCMIYMFEDTFVLPIGGEFAIINITREK